MLRIEDIECMLVNALVVGARCDGPVEALLGHLLARQPGSLARATDGVALGHELVSRRQLVASGVALMSDRTVEPLRVELTLDDGRLRLTAGRLYFGEVNQNVAIGSRAHEELRDRLLVEPDAEFAWKVRFRRSDDTWHHDPG